MSEELCCRECGGVEVTIEKENDLRGNPRKRATCGYCGKFIQFVPLETHEAIMPFGKYKGERIVDIPRSYIEWALENMDNLGQSLRQHFENARDL